MGCSVLWVGTADPRRMSVPGDLTAVDMQRLATDERGPVEIEDSVDDVADLAQPAKRLEAGHARVGRGVVHGSLDHAEGDRVDPHAMGRVFGGERACHRSQPALGEGSQGRRLWLSASSTRLGGMLTTWPLRWTTICRMTRRVTWENPARVVAGVAAYSAR